MDRLVALFSNLYKETFAEAGSDNAKAVQFLLSKLRPEYDCMPITIEARTINECIMSHSLVVVCIASKYYFIEYDWLNVMRGVSGPFDSMFELIAFVRRVYETTLKWKYGRNDLVLTLVKQT